MAAVAVLRVNGIDLAPLEIAMTRRERRRGLLGRRGLDGGLLLEPCRSVHTIGMLFAIDVAHLQRVRPDEPFYEVLRVHTMEGGCIGRPILRAHAVLEAQARELAKWGLGVGTVVEVVRA